MLYTLNLIIGPTLFILVGLLIIGTLIRTIATSEEQKSNGQKLMLWGGVGIILLIITIGITNLLHAPPSLTPPSELSR